MEKLQKKQGEIISEMLGWLVVVGWLVLSGCALPVGRLRHKQSLHLPVRNCVISHNSCRPSYTSLCASSEEINSISSDSALSKGDESNSSTDEAPNIAVSSTTPFFSLLLLNVVAVIWGTQHCVIKSLVDGYESTSLVNFWRFLLSSIIFAPSLFLKDNSVAVTNKSGNNGILLAGMELGIYTFLGFAFQAIGLETTTASRSAFLLYLNVKFVPFLSAILFQKQIPTQIWISALLALSGTYLLSTDNGPINIGDAWCIAAALASAFFIIRIGEFSNKYNAAKLNAISVSTVAFLCSLWVAGDTIASNGTGVSDMESAGNILRNNVLQPFLADPLPIIYLGGIATALCNYLQTIGQRKVPPENAAIIYSLDPLYGAFFSWLYLDEKLGAQGFAGGLLILLGVWLSARQQPK